MVTSVALPGIDSRYHRVYDGKRYIGIIIIKNNQFLARVVGRLHPKRFNNKEAAAAWIHKTYWNQEFPS